MNYKMFLVIDIYKREILFSLFLLLFANVHSQTNTAAQKTNDSLNNHAKDMADVMRKTFLKKFVSKPDTVCKRKDKLYPSIIPGAGYTLHTKFLVSVIANGAFYMNDPDLGNGFGFAPYI